MFYHECLLDVKKIEFDILSENKSVNISSGLLCNCSSISRFLLATSNEILNFFTPLRISNLNLLP